MVNKSKIAISIDAELLAVIDAEAKKFKRPRSEVIEVVLRNHFDAQRRGWAEYEQERREGVAELLLRDAAVLAAVDAALTNWRKESGVGDTRRAPGGAAVSPMKGKKKGGKRDE